MEEFKDFFEQFMEFYASSSSSRYPARPRTLKDPQLPSVATNSSPAAESEESSGSGDSNLGGMQIIMYGVTFMDVIYIATTVR